MSHKSGGTLRGPLRFIGTTSPGASTPSEGRIYFDAASNAFKVSENGGAYVTLVGGGGSSYAVAPSGGTATATGTNSFAAGIGASASATSSSAFGDNATAGNSSNATNVVAVGRNAVAGLGTSASTADCIAIGAGAQAGSNSTSDANEFFGCYAIGAGSKAGTSGKRSITNIAIGPGAQALGPSESIAIGDGATAGTGASDSDCIAIGDGASAAGVSCIALGESTASGASSCYALGGSQAGNGGTDQNITMVGDSNTGSGGKYLYGFGDVNSARNAQNVVVIGYGATNQSPHGTFLGNAFIAGSGNGHQMTDVYFGSGLGGGSSYSIHGSGGDTITANGGSVTVAGGVGFNAGSNGGDVRIAVAATGTATTLTDTVYVSGTNGNVGIGAAPGAFKLDVTGDTRVTGKLTVTGAIDPTSLSLSGSTALFIDSADGSTAPLSASGHGRLRYNDTSHQWEQSVNGGSYTAVGGGGTVTTLAPLTGTAASAGGSNALAIGVNANASATDTVAAGNNSVANGDEATAVGASANAALNGTALGWHASAASSTVAIGRLATDNSGTNAVVIGVSASAQGGCVVIGANASGGLGAAHVVIGTNASASGTELTVIGNNAQIGGGAFGSIVVGAGASATGSHQFVAGASTAAISDIYIGNGVTAAAPQDVVYHGSGSGTNGTPGGVVTIAGGLASQAADAGGDVRLSVAVAGTGTTLSNVVYVSGSNGNVGIGATPGSYKLDVTGDTRVVGKLTVTGAIDPLSLSLSGSTALFIDSADGSTAPVSATGHARIRYNNSSLRWEQSVNGSAYAAFGGGGGGTTYPVAPSGGTYTTSASGSSSIVAGEAATDNGNGNAVVVGQGAQATAQYGVVAGWNSNVGYNSVTVGASSGNSGQNAVVVGSNASNSTNDVVLVGQGITTDSNAGGGVAIGQGSSLTNGGGSLAIGQGANSGGSSNIVVGQFATSSGFQSISIGWEASSNHSKCIAIGTSSLATGDNQLVVGGLGSEITDLYFGASVTSPVNDTGRFPSPLPNAVIHGTGGVYIAQVTDPGAPTAASTNDGAGTLNPGDTYNVAITYRNKNNFFGETNLSPLTPVTVNPGDNAVLVSGLSLPSGAQSIGVFMETAPGSGVMRLSTTTTASSVTLTSPPGTGNEAPPASNSTSSPGYGFNVSLVGGAYDPTNVTNEADGEVSISTRGNLVTISSNYDSGIGVKANNRVEILGVGDNTGTTGTGDGVLIHTQSAGSPSSSNSGAISILTGDGETSGDIEIRTGSAGSSTGAVTIDAGSGGSAGILNLGVANAAKVLIAKASGQVGFFGATGAVQNAPITNPAGGATVDAEARVAIISILGALRNYGLIQT